MSDWVALKTLLIINKIITLVEYKYIFVYFTSWSKGQVYLCCIQTINIS